MTEQILKPVALTMEDVSYIPLDDISAMHAVGICEKEVAATFFDLFKSFVSFF